MAKRIFFSLLLLGNSFFLFAQLRNTKADSLRYYIYNVDTSKIILDSQQLKKDSIQVKTKLFSDKIIATCYFGKSKTELRIEFYLKNNALVFVKIVERSPIFSDLNRFTELYFENCHIFYESYYRSIRICMPIDLKSDTDAFYGYNKTITSDFLKRYVLELFNLITGSTCYRFFV